MSGEREQGLAEVRYLPARSEVVEGEVVTEAEYQASQRERAAVRRQMYRRDAVTVARTVRTVATHEHTRTVIRHVTYVAAGAVVVGRRVWDARTNSRYERMMRAAEAQGDVALVAEWADRAERARAARHSRRMELLNSPLRAARAALVTLMLGGGGLLVLGIVLAVAEHRIHAVVEPIMFVIHVVQLVALVVSVVWGPIVLAAPWLALLGLWAVGRAHATPPAFLAPAPDGDGEGGREIVPSESSILLALSNLGVPALTRAYKQGWGTPGWPIQVWEQTPIKDGHGWRARIRLPQQAPVETIVGRRAVLAHNLVRSPREVWVSEPRERPGVMDLWVADPGALSGPVPAWPLLAKLDSTTGDYFKPVPVGVGLRGEQMRGRLFEANWALAGMMGSGKSSLIISLLCGALLDPLVEAHVFVMAHNADYQAMQPRLASLVTGSGEDTVVSCLARLRQAYADLTIRGKALAEHDARAVTRELAARDPRLRPTVIVIDECQALFLDEKHGEEAVDLAVKLLNAARKYAISLIFATPEPSSTSLPRRLMAVISCKACFAIGDQTANDAILGTGSYKSGVSAMGLEPKTDEGPGDVGTCMTRGVTAKPALMRCHYLDQDQVRRVMARAMELRAGVPALPAALAGDGQREPDPLADIAAVMGAQTLMRTQDVLQELARLRPEYRGWTFGRLKTVLTEHEAAPRKTRGGVMHVDARLVAVAIARRDDDVDDTPDDHDE